METFTAGAKREAVWSVVRRSRLTSNIRVDSEYYQPVYLVQEAKIAALHPKPLSDLAFVSDGNHMAISDKFTDSGVRYLRGQDLSDFFVSDANPICIPYSEYQKLQRSHMKPGDVLLSIVGTIGSVAIVTDKYPHLTGSCKIAIVRPKSVNPYYFATYLASRVGQDQIARRIRGAVQQGLILPDLKEFPVPIIDDRQVDEIEGLVRESRKRWEEADVLYAEAEALLLAELGLHGLDLSHQPTYTQNFSQAWAAGRLDAEYFQPKYYRILAGISSITERKGWPVRRIDQISGPLKYGTSTKLEYLREGVPFLRIADVSGRRFSLDSIQYISETQAKQEQEASVKTGDVLVSRSGTLGLAVAIPEYLKNAVFGSYFIRVRADSSQVIPEYLALFINSSVGGAQVDRLSTGAIQTNLTIPAIESIHVPVPPLNIQKIMVRKVLDSFAVEDEAKRWLEEAKGRVEEMVLLG